MPCCLFYCHVGSIRSLLSELTLFGFPLLGSSQLRHTTQIKKSFASQFLDSID